MNKKQKWLGVVASWDYDEGRVKDFVSKVGAGSVICTRGGKGAEMGAFYEAIYSGKDAHVFALHEERGTKGAYGRRDRRLVDSVDKLVVFWDESDDYLGFITRIAEEAGKLWRIYGRDGNPVPDEAAQRLLKPREWAGRES